MGFYYGFGPFYSLFNSIFLLCYIVIWGAIAWQLLTKAGYRDVSRLVMLFMMVFPALAPFGLVLFVLMPWPIQQQVNELRQRIGESSVNRTAVLNDIDTDLNRLKGQMGLTRVKRSQPPK